MTNLQILELITVITVVGAFGAMICWADYELTKDNYNNKKK